MGLHTSVWSLGPHPGDREGESFLLSCLESRLLPGCGSGFATELKLFGKRACCPGLASIKHTCTQRPLGWEDHTKAGREKH